MGKRGQPRKPPELKKSEIVTVALTPSLKDAIAGTSGAAGVPFSQWMRQAAVEKLEREKSSGGTA